MIAPSLDSLTHPPEVIVAFIRELIAERRSYAGPERRSESRWEMCLPVTVQCLDDHYRPVELPIQTQTFNLSGGGIGFIHPRPVTCRFVLVQLKSLQGNVMNLMASIRHCSQIAGQYQIGARFVVKWSESARHCQPRTNGEASG